MSRNYFGTIPDRDFGKKLRALIDAAGYSVDGFAKALGVHRDTPQKWFSGQSFPQRKYHHKISKLLKVPVDGLFASGAYSVPHPGPDMISEDNELLNAYREINRLRKELEYTKKRIHELEKLLLVYQSRQANDKRKGDDQGLNPLKLRRPVVISNHS
jgi:transcriptional regulator with XRE-family HTH domain